MLLEGRLLLTAWRHAVSSPDAIDTTIDGNIIAGSSSSVRVDGTVSSSYLFFNLLFSGFSYYMYNEVAFWILGIVSPITHAVGNTVKRVVIIFASIIILHTPVSVAGACGSLLAVFGTLLYSLAIHRTKEQRRKKLSSF